MAGKCSVAVLDEVGAVPFLDHGFLEIYPIPIHVHEQPAVIPPVLLYTGLQVVIATNPLFPLTAIEQRLEWAGLPVEEFPFALITSYEIMHSTKPHLAYYEEIAQRLGVEEKKCLMVGDDWRLDIAPAYAVGMQTYWVADTDVLPPTPGIHLSGQGSLTDLSEWLRSTELED